MKFPPAYPGVLAALWLALGALRPVMLAAVFLNLALLAGSGALLAFALHHGADLPKRTALLLGGLALASADVWRFALVPLSEPLFIALAAAALALWVQGASQPSRRVDALLALVLALAVLTRTAGAALVAGMGVASLSSRGWRVAARHVTPAVLSGVAWGAYATLRAPAVPAHLSDVLGPYGGWLSDQLLGAPGDFLANLPGHVLAVVRTVSTLLLPALGGWVLWAAALPALALVGWGLALLARRMPPLAWIPLAYLAMLFVWPFVDRRLVAPLHPLLVIAAGVAVLEAWHRLGTRARNALAVVTLGWVVSFTVVTADRASRGWTAAPYQLRAGRLAAAIETLERTAPADAVVGAPEFWAALHLHGDWATVPSALFSPRGEEEDAPLWGSPEAQLRLWWATGLDHVLLEQGGQIHGDALNRIEAACPGSVGVLATMPPQMLVRLEWDEACAERLGVGEDG